MFSIGDTVFVTSNPQKVGIIEQISGNQCLIRYYSNSSKEWKKDIYLTKQEVSDLQKTISDYIASNEFGTLEDVAMKITHVRLNGNLNDIIYSMETTNTDFYAYQFKPVLKIINSPSNSILIGDEVGLGKTIEAALIWTELKQRYNFKRLLVVCPGILREKWKNELYNKIGCKAYIANGKEFLESIKNEEFALISSFQGISRKEILSQIKNMASEENDLIDLLIVDEAHYARNDATHAYKAISLLREISDYACFLSATPIQNKRNDLFSLVHILDPQNFQYYSSFENALENNERLVKLKEKLLQGLTNRDEIISKLNELKSSWYWSKNKQLDALLMSLSKENKEITLTKAHMVAYELDEIFSLGYIFNRTRKKDVKESKVIRDVAPENIEMSKDETELYNFVTNKIVEYAEDKNIGNFESFLLCTPQRMLSSSFYPTLMRWRKENLSNLSDFYEDEDEYLLDQQEFKTNFMKNLSEALSDYKGSKNLYNNDTKYSRLIKIIKELVEKNSKEKIVLFSSFVTTLEYLNFRLGEDGIGSILLCGKVKDKNEILTKFKHDSSCQILLASEVGSEGVDLQFCRFLINYDLPWNPMRIEQRIGRLDRIGQKSPKILIWNLFHDSTIDQRVYEKLYSKFDICTSALGDFEIVLGEQFKKLSLDLLKLSEEEQEKRLEQTRQAIEHLKVENEKLEEQASQITAYGDYITQQIQRSKNENKIITPQDLSLYVCTSLKKLYPDTHISRKSQENEFAIMTTSQFRNDFSDYCEINHFSTNNKFLNEYGNIDCIFQKQNFQDARSEIIYQRHPLVRFIAGKTNYNEKSVAICKIKDPNVVGLYVISVSLTEAIGVTKYDKLIYSGYNVTKDKDIETETAEKIFLTAIRNGKDWITRKDLNYSLLSKISDKMIEKNDELYIEEVKKLSNKNEDRAFVQQKSIELEIENKRKKLEEEIAKLKDSGKEKMIPARQGRFDKLYKKLSDKLLKIEDSKELKHDNTNLASIIVKVEA